MVRVLVVDHDVDLADLKVDTLRRAGFEVDQCAGPTHALVACPVLGGLPCWQAEWADVLVYDVWAAGDSGQTLTQNLLRQYPDKAIVLTSQGIDVGWAQGEVRVTMAESQSRDSLVNAVEAAYAGRVAPVPPASSSSATGEGLVQQ